MPLEAKKGIPEGDKGGRCDFERLPIPIIGVESVVEYWL